MRVKLLLPYIFFMLLGSLCTVMAAETDVLPKGVRTAIFRQNFVNISSQFGNDNKLANFSLAEEIVALDISEEPSIQDIVNEVKKLDPSILNNISMGEVSFTGQVDASVQAYAFGWGLTDKLTLAGVLPIYNVKAQIEGQYNSHNGLGTLADRVRSYGSSNANALIIANLLDSLPRDRGEHLQGYFTSMGFKPFGSWNATGLGDIMLMAKYRFINNNNYRQALQLGAELPTGRKDDPDNLVDFAFGNEAFGNNIESIHDYFLFDQAVTLTAKAGLFYYWSAAKEVRLVESPTNPLTANKETLQFQPGIKFKASGGIDYKPHADITLASRYLYQRQAKDDYSNGVNQNYNYDILEKHTKNEAHKVNLGLSYSTINKFLDKKFPVPFSVTANYETTLAGRNTEKANITYVELQMFF